MKPYQIVIPIILLGSIISIWMIYFVGIEKGEQIVKCYDENNNEIIGLDCIDEPDSIHTPIKMSIIFIFLGVVCIGFFSLLNL